MLLMRYVIIWLMYVSKYCITPLVGYVSGLNQVRVTDPDDPPT